MAPFPFFWEKVLLLISDVWCNAEKCSTLKNSVTWKITSWLKGVIADKCT